MSYEEDYLMREVTSLKERVDELEAIVTYPKGKKGGEQSSAGTNSETSTKRPQRTSGTNSPGRPKRARSTGSPSKPDPEENSTARSATTSTPETDG